MTTRRSVFPRSNVVQFPGPGDRTPSPRSLRLVKPSPPASDNPEQSDTFETVPGSRASEPNADATLGDGDVGTLVFERVTTAIPPAPETELMLDRPLPAPSAPELPPIVPTAAPSETSVADLTEVMFDADAAMFPLGRRPQAIRA